MASSISMDEADALPKRPTTIQLYQLVHVRPDFERVPEHSGGSKIAIIGNTDW